MRSNCPHCGHDLPAEYKRLEPQRIELRGYLIPALVELCRAGRGLTLDEIAGLSDDPTRIRRHFAQLKHFKLIRKDVGRYFPTELAKNFVNGHAQVPDVVWTLDGQIVDALQPVASVFAWAIPGNGLSRPFRPIETYQPKLLPT